MRLKWKLIKFRCQVLFTVCLLPKQWTPGVYLQQALIDDQVKTSPITLSLFKDTFIWHNGE